MSGHLQILQIHFASNQTESRPGGQGNKLTRSILGINSNDLGPQFQKPKPADVLKPLNAQLLYPNFDLLWTRVHIPPDITVSSYPVKKAARGCLLLM